MTQITVAFGAPVTLVGAGFEVFTPQEAIVQPNVFTEDDMVFLLQLDEPLAGGEVGVRYEVTAADGHVLEGGFRFTVPVAVPVTTTAPASEPASGTTSALSVDTTAPAVIAPAPVTTATTPTSTLDAAAADVPDGDDGDDGSSTGAIIGVVAALVLGAVAFVVLRSRGARAT